MVRFKSMRLSAAVTLAAVVILVVGGSSVASNMGFKLNKAIVVANLSDNVGNNWVSLPYNNPYTTINSFCTALGLRTGIGIATRVTIPIQTNNSNNPVQAACGTTAGNALLPTDGTGVLVEWVPCTNPATCTPLEPAGTVKGVIIVGSHDPVKVIDTLDFCNVADPAIPRCSPTHVPPTPPTGRGLRWFSLPYHTTATTVKDLCLSAGLTSQITPPGSARVDRIDAATGSSFGAACAGNTGTGVNLVLGEAVLIRETISTNGGTRSFIPAHF